jgi:putative ABC transport system permease protein
MLSFQETVTAVEIGVIYGILAIGIYLTFRIINFPDLTCDGSFITGAAISSVMIKSGCDPCISLLFSMIGGGLAGFCTGALSVWMKTDDLLSGIIVAFMLYSINLRIMGSSPNIVFSDTATVFGGGSPFFMIFAVVFSAVLFFGYILNTDFGLGLRAVGQNKRFALVSGVNAGAMIIFGLIAGNATVGLCGAVFTQYQGFCDVSQGTGCLVVGLASVIIGENLLHNFSLKFSRQFQILLAVASCVVGSVIYRIFIAFAVNSDVLGCKTQDINLITGLLMIFIMRMRKTC